MATRRKPVEPTRRERLFNRPTARSGSFAMVQPTRNTIDVSSAALHTIGEARTQARKHRRIQADTGWQTEAFDSVEKVGELGYVMNLKANTVAMCDFAIRKWDEETRTWVKPDESEDDKPARVMEAFVGPQGGQYDLKRRLAWHLSVSGESLMLGTTGNGQDGILWEFLSVAELKLGSDGKYTRYRDGAGAGESLPDEHYVARCWRSSPIYSDRADCEVKRVLPIAKELIRLTQMIDAIASSRLPAKILVIPDEATFAGQEEDHGGDVEESDEALDPFVEEIFQHNSAAVTDPSSAARLTPLVMRVPMEMASPNSVFTIDLARDVDTWGAALRTESLQRLAQGLDSPPETMTGKSSLSHWCVDDTTEILTRDGWVTHDRLNPGDLVLTLNHDTGLSEWQPVGTVNRWDVDGLDMMSIEGDRHSSLTTMNHRWPVIHTDRDNVRLDDGTMTSRVSGRSRKWRTSEQLRTNDALVVGASAGDVPTEQKWSDAMVELVAWFWTEGSANVRPGRDAPQVSICQSMTANPDYCARIRRALTTLYGPATTTGTMGGGWPRANPRSTVPLWRERRNGNKIDFLLNRVAAAPLIDIAPGRVVSLDFIHELTASQLDLFVDVSIRADGTYLPAGTAQIAQKDSVMLDAVELAAVLSGRSTHRWLLNKINHDRAGRLYSQTMVSISAKTTFTLGNKARSTVPYTGVIWCPTTPNQTWMARRNGKAYFTGNSAFNIDADFLAKHVKPVGELMADFVTFAYLRPMLEAFEDMDADEAAQWRIELDMASVSARQNEAEGAEKLAHLITDEARLKAHGFDLGDMADDETITQRRIWELVTKQPAQFAKLLTKLLGFEDFAVDAPTPPVAPLPVPSVNGDGGTGAAPEMVKQPDVEPDMQPPDGLSVRLIERLATAADAHLMRALDRAGARVVSATQRDVTIRDRLKGDKARALTMIRDDELGRFSLTRESLLEGAWDALRADVSEWITADLTTNGVPTARAHETATQIATVLCHELDAYALEATRVGAVRHAGNGLRVPGALIDRCLHAALTAT